MMNEHAYINARLRQASKAMNFPGPLVAIPLFQLDQLKYLFYPDEVVIFNFYLPTSTTYAYYFFLKSEKSNNEIG